MVGEGKGGGETWYEEPKVVATVVKGGRRSYHHNYFYARSQNTARSVTLTVTCSANTIKPGEDANLVH